MTMTARRVAGVGVGCAAALCLLAAPAGAWAQGGDETAERTPGTITLDRMDASTRVGVQAGLIKADRIDGWFLRSEVYGQYVARSKGSGFYGQFPIARFHDATGPDATAVGAVEVGGFLLPRHSSATILRVGFAIGNGHDGPGVPTAHLFAANERLTDFVLTSPGFTTLRMSASKVVEDGGVFFRGDLGIDVVVVQPGNVPPLYVRANGAVGLRTDHADIAVELVNLCTLGAAGDSFFHTATVGVRTPGKHQLHAGVVFPLDGYQRGEVWILSLGYQYSAN